MKNTEEINIPLNFQELKLLFMRLKREENTLSAAEQEILLKIEKKLYQTISVQDAEKLMREITKD